MKVSETTLNINWKEAELKLRKKKPNQCHSYSITVIKYTSKYRNLTFQLSHYLKCHASMEVSLTVFSILFPALPSYFRNPLSLHDVQFKIISLSCMGPWCQGKVGRRSDNEQWKEKCGALRLNTPLHQSLQSVMPDVWHVKTKMLRRCASYFTTFSHPIVSCVSFK